MVFERRRLLPQRANANNLVLRTAELAGTGGPPGDRFDAAANQAYNL